jgi:hypothetical protein
MTDVVVEDWQTTGILDIKFGKTIVKLEMRLNYILTGDLRQVIAETMVTRLGVQDPIGAYRKAIVMTFFRPNSNAKKMSIELGILSKKPSHGVATGTDALNIVVALAKHLNCKVVILTDASTVECGLNKSYSLRQARILSKGAGWYESKGFKSLIESLHPRQYNANVPKLHGIPLKELVQVLGHIDAALRAIILDRKSIKRCKVIKYTTGDLGPKLINATFKDIIEIVNHVSVPLDIISSNSNSKDLKGTLGAFIDRMIGHDCAIAADIVNALLPYSSEYVELKTLPDGSDAPTLPHHDAWVFTWKLTKTYPELTLTVK